MIAEYLGLVMLFAAAASIPAALLVVHWITTRRGRDRTLSSDFASTSESVSQEVEVRANTSERSPRLARRAVAFYRVALLFGLLNTAVVLLYAWGAALRALGWPGLVTAGLFTLPLAVAVVHQWRNRVFEW